MIAPVSMRVPPERNLRQQFRAAAGVIHRRWVWPTWSTLRARWQLWWWGVRLPRNLTVRGRLHVHNAGTFSLGERVRFNSGHANYVGASSPVALWTGPGGSLVIGPNCAISNATIVSLKAVEIREGTYIGGGVRIYDTDFHSFAEVTGRGDPIRRDAPVLIGPRSFIGGHSTILKGVTIGQGAIIGASSVVTRDVPDGEIWAGNPARFVRRVEDPGAEGEGS